MRKKEDKTQKKSVYADEEPFYPNLSDVASATECTGLMPTPPQTESELESYKELHSMEIPKKLPGKYDDTGAYSLREKSKDPPRCGPLL